MKSSFPPTLETKRLLLRPITEEDAPAIYEYASNPKVAQHTLWDHHQSLQDSLNFICGYVAERYKNQEPEPFGIALKSSPQKIIGTVGCFWISKPYQTMELGYALAESYWNKGIATEASRTILDFVFKNYAVRRIQAPCRIENIGSKRVMEKLGMKFEGILRSARFCKGKFWDVHLCSLLKEEFFAEDGFIR